ncbi:carboxymuconolactone decarboxylase family protein [Sphingomonas phyllosphaerae]|uniref:carboxymuconolactone decarboxylase family protein n=1 Tax=Sphingomonas phyllosphaerae TaxID=257003 RepID=UPI002413C0BC|nr:carboxymuconolactone decarboxylase family protein [Sphingomonas phyllosphaerae]
MTESNDVNSAMFAMLDAVAPPLAPYTRDRIIDELWHRPGLSTRDRAIVTLATLIARNAAQAYPYYTNKALDSGVAPVEVSELVVHLAFYAGWPSAVGALAVIKDVFASRGIGRDALAPCELDLLPSTAIPDGVGQDAYIGSEVASVSPALAHFSRDLLDQEIWRRPDLAPRDRSLATVTALAALGQTERFPLYVSRAIALGVTTEQLGEALAHTAFYGGWGLAHQAALALGRSLQLETGATQQLRDPTTL